eukprot:643723-Pleurochrysis_carterae.AAC.1
MKRGAEMHSEIARLGPGAINSYLSTLTLLRHYVTCSLDARPLVHVARNIWIRAATKACQAPPPRAGMRKSYPLYKYHALSVRVSR